ncbi:hypothetical protein A2U01_0031403, partial [Trifolium medium]|nr:hypothetical protein [Trifolium medium]
MHIHACHARAGASLAAPRAAYRSRAPTRIPELRLAPPVLRRAL